MGGVGNQMFQYALGRTLSEKYNQPLKFDLSYFHRDFEKIGLPRRTMDLDIFNFNISIASQKEIDFFLKNPASLTERVKRKLSTTFNPRRYIHEHQFNFIPEILEQSGNVYLEGYWQSEKYFKGIAELLRQEFELNLMATEETNYLLKEIQDSESICINIRRQEFVSLSLPNYFVGLEYYNRAIKLIKEKVDRPYFYIFSDDLKWVRESFVIENSTIVGEKFYGLKYGTYLKLMSSCKHFIIPNSSFAWWASWLGNYPSKNVIAPDAWFRDSTIDTTDLIPSNWLRV